jgi:hypothetical protein
MTTLAAHDLDPNQLDLLALVADNSTPLGRLHRDDFEQACRAVEFDGIVDPNLVSAWLHTRFGEVKPQWLSAMWCASCGPSGFMDKTDAYVPIDGKHSKGNANKSVQLRRLR